jgi:hypothetical protein
VTRFDEFSAIIYFGQFSEKNTKKIPNCRLLFFPRYKTDALLLKNNGLGNILGDFSTAPSGHPAADAAREAIVCDIKCVIYLAGCQQ